jgi:hypothetical protein
MGDKVKNSARAATGTGRLLRTESQVVKKKKERMEKNKGLYVLRTTMGRLCLK